MSFVISKKQHLAPTEARVQYRPLIFEDKELEVERVDVNFGHPLYTAVADIFYVRSAVCHVKHFPLVPDGCMALVFKVCGENTQGYLCGAIDEIKKMEIYPDAYYIVIRFLPGMGYSFLRDDTNKLTNQSAALGRYMDGGDQILSILRRDIQMVERIRLISKMIRVRMRNEPNQYLIKYCTERIFLKHGNIRVEELAEETGFTSRYIGKLFERCVGLSPKLYSQIIRLQFSMNRIMQDKDKLLVEIAEDCGFFDHAHMNRTYKKLIGCSSGDFRKNLLGRLDYGKIDSYIPDSASDGSENLCGDFDIGSIAAV